MKLNLKKMLALVFCALLVLSGCSDSEGGVGYGSGGSSAGAGFVSPAGKGNSEAEQIVNALSNLDLNNVSVTVDATLTVDDALVSMLEEEDIDLYGIKNAAVSMTVGSNRNLVGSNVKASVNDTYIASANVTADMSNGDVYFALPEVNPTAIKVEGQQELVDSEMMALVQKEINDITKILSRYDVVALVEDYADTSLKAFGEPDDKFQQYVDAGNLSAKMNGESYLISEVDGYNVLTAVLQKVKNDNTVRQITTALIPEIGDLMQAVDPASAQEFKQAVKGDFFNEVLVPEIDELLEDIEEEKEYAGEYGDIAEVVVLYDGKDVAGFELYSLEEGYKQLIAAVHYVVDGDYTAVEINLMDEAEIVVSGKNVKGKFTGKLQVEAEDTKLNFGLKDIDVEKFMYGIFDGTIIVDDTILGDETPAELEGFKIEISVSNTVLKSDVSLKAFYQEQILAAVNVKMSLSDRTVPVSIPGNYILSTDDASTEKWVEDMSIATIVTNLDKAGVSGTLIASLQGAM